MNAEQLKVINKKREGYGNSPLTFEQAATGEALWRSTMPKESCLKWLALWQPGA